MDAQSKTSATIVTVGALLGLAAAGMAFVWAPKEAPQAPDGSVSANGSKIAKDTQATVQSAQTAAAIPTLKAAALPEDKTRTSQAFFSLPLWQLADKDAAGQVRTAVVDILGKNSVDIHRYGEENTPVPNLWFLNNGLAKEFTQSDALQKDSDGDGFTNLEEFVAKTKPNDAASYPALVTPQGAKLEVVRTQTNEAVIVADTMFATEPAPAQVAVKVFKNAADLTPINKLTLKPGDKFALSADDKEKSRFTLVGFEKAEFTDSMGKHEENVIVLQDNTFPNSAPVKVRAGKPKANEKDAANAKGLQYKITSATLRVTAGSAANTEITVRKGDSFTVPGSSIKCSLQAVGKGSSVSILPEGSDTPVQVLKAPKN